MASPFSSKFIVRIKLNNLDSSKIGILEGSILSNFPSYSEISKVSCYISKNF